MNYTAEQQKMVRQTLEVLNDLRRHAALGRTARATMDMPLYREALSKTEELAERIERRLNRQLS